MNTKIILLTGFVILVVLAVGGGFLLMKGKPVAPQTGVSVTQVPKEENKNVFTSIKDALSKSLSLNCSFTDDTGRVTKSFIKNGAVRADFTGKTLQDTGSVIVKDKKMYVWTADKKGFTMELTDEQLSGKAVSTGSATNTTVPQQSNILADLEKYKNNCKSGVVADNLFVPPTDVTFSDLTQLMKAVPTGAQGTAPGTSDSGVSQQQIDDLMKKYAPSGTP